MSNELKFYPEKTASTTGRIPQKTKIFIGWLENKNRKIQFFALIVFLFSGMAGSLFFSYFFIYRTFPILWHWGFAPTATFWQEFLSVITTPYIVFGGLLPLVLLSDTLHNILSLLITKRSKKDNTYDVRKDINDRICEILKQPLYEANEEHVTH